MSINNFLTKENISTIWDVISDEEIFKFLSRDKQSKIAQIFESNLVGFFNAEKVKSGANLVELNKKYILLILKYIKDVFPQQPVKIKIHNDRAQSLNKSTNINNNINIQAKELITFEEIQNEKKSKFEKDLNARQDEFLSSMTVKAPPVPEFSDKHEDKPITDMEKIIKEMTEQRNYEVETIGKKQSLVNNDNNSDTWLKPQETSIKNEKFSQNQLSNNNTNNNSNNNKLKYIKIDDNNGVTLLEQKKNVSWGENITMEYQNLEDDINEDSIFSKLKKVSNNTSINNNVLENDRISILENKVNMLNSKIDKLIDILNAKNV